MSLVVALFLLQTGTNDGANGDYGGFYTWLEVLDRVEKLRALRPELLEKSSIGRTTEGREIPILKVSGGAPGEKPEILLMAGIHPREQQPLICILELLGELVEKYGKDERLTRLVNEHRIWFLPVLNVDGKVYDMKHGNGKDKGANWRKNRRKNADGTVGVDLNRNFPVRWGSGNVEGNSEVYEGPRPLSEPETQALERFFEERPIRAFVDVHSCMKAILYPAYLIGPEEERYSKLGGAMRAAQKDAYRLTEAVRDDDPPRTRGGNTGLSYAWAYYAHGVYSFIFEVAGKGFYDSPVEIRREYEKDVRDPLLRLIEASADLPLPKKGAAVLREAAVDGKLAPNARRTWMPKVEGPCDFGVLTTGDLAIEVSSEFRVFPLKSGFSLQVSAKAKPLTQVPMVLYLWDRERGRSIERFTLSIEAP